jgi:beta-glucosidase
MSGRKSLKFPERFLWGAATSAHQIEGGLHNQWTVWELENARALAAQAPYHYSDLERWPAIKKQAQNPANYVSGKAIDHYKYFREDIALLKTLNLNAYRFSIEWSSIW